MVVGELSAELLVARRVAPGAGSGTGWRPVQQLRTSTAAPGTHVQPSGIVSAGSRLFVANRGPDTVSVFDRQGDHLVRVGEFSCGGAWPRDLTVAAGALWVANERSNAITAFAFDDLAGDRPVLSLPTPSPTRVVVLGSD